MPIPDASRMSSMGAHGRTSSSPRLGPVRGLEFAPVIGEILAQSATGGPTAHNTSRYRLDRFGRSALRPRTVLKWTRHGPATTIAELLTKGGAYGEFQAA